MEGLDLAMSLGRVTEGDYAERKDFLDMRLTLARQDFILDRKRNR
jgi:hypothetical protein